MQTYTHACSRCGFCCVSTPCPHAMMKGAAPGQPCPYLTLESPSGASCAIVEALPALAGAFGIGAGCCMAARAYAGGKCYDFASLPPATKAGIAWQKHTQSERG